MIDVKNYAFLGQRSQEKKIENLKKENYSRIYAHEAAHKNAAGSLGGPIVIEYSPQGIPIGGHVNIRIPALNRENPDETISQAKQIKRAALAPVTDLSDADLNVARQAETLLSEAESYKKDQSKSGETLDLIG
ncbi:TPA: hypothetical protein IAA86_05990 [Candidatus Galligastranaerophilus intestinavium]|uniref:SprA-related family protein n=1 Tax=Candidatus Galligastranaerophilus intestinavium TaxID=2840836 RepID=A0A9D1FIM2_9BACT|nr:hypothetical protein [Candidatus Galligastranaerophilus intestinavium]